MAFQVDNGENVENRIAGFAAGGQSPATKKISSEKNVTVETSSKTSAKQEQIKDFFNQYVAIPFAKLFAPISSGLRRWLNSVTPNPTIADVVKTRKAAAGVVTTEDEAKINRKALDGSGQDFEMIGDNIRVGKDFEAGKLSDDAFAGLLDQMDVSIDRASMSLVAMYTDPKQKDELMEGLEYERKAAEEVCVKSEVQIALLKKDVDYLQEEVNVEKARLASVEKKEPKNYFLQNSIKVKIGQKSALMRKVKADYDVAVASKEAAEAELARVNGRIATVEDFKPSSVAPGTDKTAVSLRQVLLIEEMDRAAAVANAMQRRYEVAVEDRRIIMPAIEDATQELEQAEKDLAEAKLTLKCAENTLANIRGGKGIKGMLPRRRSEETRTEIDSWKQEVKRAKKIVKNRKQIVADRKFVLDERNKVKERCLANAPSYLDVKSAKAAADAAEAAYRKFEQSSTATAADFDKMGEWIPAFKSMMANGNVGSLAATNLLGYVELLADLDPMNRMTAEQRSIMMARVMDMAKRYDDLPLIMDMAWVELQKDGSVGDFLRSFAENYLGKTEDGREAKPTTTPVADTVGVDEEAAKKKALDALDVAAAGSVTRDDDVTETDNSIAADGSPDGTGEEFNSDLAADLDSFFAELSLDMATEEGFTNYVPKEPSTAVNSEADDVFQQLLKEIEETGEFLKELEDIEE